MFDFEQALDAGMAFRIDLTAEQASDGFERWSCWASGSATRPRRAQQNLERLLEHHLHSRPGLEILAAGDADQQHGEGRLRAIRSATTRTRASTSSSARRRSTRRERSAAAPRRPVAGRAARAAARARAAHPERRRPRPERGARDADRAVAGHARLHDEDAAARCSPTADVAATREFFTRYVSGRGPLPALRIGAQPYGILPTTAFDRAELVRRRARTGSAYCGRLYAILQAHRRRLEAARRPGELSSASVAATRTRCCSTCSGCIRPRSSTTRCRPRASSTSSTSWRSSTSRSRSTCSACSRRRSRWRCCAASATPATEVPDLLNKIYQARADAARRPADRRPAAVGERADPRLRRQPELHRVAGRRGPARASARSSRSRDSTAARSRPRCSICCCATPCS